MKFEVGDKVKIKGNRTMLPSGTIGAISSINYDICELELAVPFLDKYFWFVNESNLELLKKYNNNNIPSNKFFFKGDKTIYYDKDGERYCVKCCEDDKYDKTLGMLYVLAKAQKIDLREIDELIEEPKKEQKKDKKTKWKIGDMFIVIDNKHFDKSIRNGEKGIIIDILDNTTLGNKVFWLNIGGYTQLIGDDIDDCLRRI